MRFTKTIIAGLAMAITAGAASGAFAATPWERHHPRRAEVNERLAHQQPDGVASDGAHRGDSRDTDERETTR